jgi:hypothetical protein
MSDSILERIPVVAGLGYVERVRPLPSSFVATLQVEPENRYFRHAIAVTVNGEKVGYVAPEIARSWWDAIRGATRPVSCPARRASQSDHETSGVELLLDFSRLELERGSAGGTG